MNPSQSLDSRLHDLDVIMSVRRNLKSEESKKRRLVTDRLRKQNERNNESFKDKRKRLDEQKLRQRFLRSTESLKNFIERKVC